MKSPAPLVGIVMGSDSDWPVMKAATEVCIEFGIPFEARVVSAHRTPDDTVRYGHTAHRRGIRVIIAGAGGAAHLPGILASHSPLPVIGVPVQSKALQGLDSLLSIVQMPAGVPVATVAIGAGRNAGLLAVQILATSDPALLEKLLAYKAAMTAEVRARSRKVTREAEAAASAAAAAAAGAGAGTVPVKSRPRPAARTRSRI